MTVREVDGSLGEGGGQVLRYSFGVASCLGFGVRVINVRAKRPNPGLQGQHLSGIRLATEIVGGSLQGDAIKSPQVEFTPSEVESLPKAGAYKADAVTAGSVSLILQAALPCLLFNKGETKLSLHGGTDVSFSPPFDFLVELLLPFLTHHTGWSPQLKMVHRGLYPRGGGVVEVQSTPIPKGRTLPSFSVLNRGDLQKIEGRVFVAGPLPKRAADNICQAASKVLRGTFDVPIDIEIAVNQPPTKAPGSGIVLWATTDQGCRIGASTIGNKKLKDEEVGVAAAEMLVANIQHGGCVDEHVQDMAVLFMALAEGESKLRTGPLTLHTETAIDVLQQLTGVKFEVQKEPDETFIVSCKGMGLQGRGV